MNRKINQSGRRKAQWTSFIVLAVLFTGVLAVDAANALQAPEVVAGIPVNYDEANVGNYVLPDPLMLENGEIVEDADTWYEQRRPEILELFKEFQYGHTPGPPADLRFDVFDTGTPAFDGTAIRKQITVYFTADDEGPKMDLLLYLPADGERPAPVLLNAGFSANSSMVDDPGVKRGEIWRQGERVPAPENGFGSLNVPLLISNGIGIASVYYGDIEPDFIGGLELGVIAHYQDENQVGRKADEWGSISAWAWGLSRAMDYFETDEDVDASRIALMGISRLGKTVLWTAARDDRFAAVIASCSGEGGAAISKRNFGETVGHLTAPTRYPYQFSESYHTFSDHLNHLPVDANLLLSLIAPRRVLLQTGDEDLWSDPKGEFLAAADASRVYELLGAEGLADDQWPAPGVLVPGDISYYMHDGGHGTVPSDWDVFISFLQESLSVENN